MLLIFIYSRGHHCTTQRCSACASCSTEHRDGSSYTRGLTRNTTRKLIHDVFFSVILCQFGGFTCPYPHRSRCDSSLIPVFSIVFSLSAARPFLPSFLSFLTTVCLPLLPSIVVSLLVEIISPLFSVHVSICAQLLSNFTSG